MDKLHSNFTTACSNKNNNKKKKMEKFGCITKCRKLLKQLSKVSAIVQTTKHSTLKGHSEMFLTKIESH